MKKFNFRKMLMTGAAMAVLAGAAWYGWDYWTVGQYLVSTDDAYVQGRQHHDRAEGFRLPAARCWSATMSRSRPARCWRGSTTRDFQVALDQAKADVAAAQAAITSKQAQLDVQQAVIDAAKATVEVDSATVDLRRPGEQALHRPGRDRLWQRAERPAGAIAHRRRQGRDRSATPPTSPPR